MSERARQVLERFVRDVEAMASDPNELLDAVAFGLERALDELLRSACREEGMDAEEFSAIVDRAEHLRAELQERLGQLFHPAAIARARARAQVRELEMDLQTYRYLLGGADPDPWVWRALDPDERGRLRAERQGGTEDDAELLARIERALEALARDPGAYGRCETCGVAIPTDRLQLVPWAERCTPCQRAIEARGTRAPSASVPVLRFTERTRVVVEQR